MMLIFAFLFGLMLGPVIAVLLGAYIHWRKENAPKPPEPHATLMRDWRLWRENGRTFLELTQRLVHPDGRNFFSSFTVEHAKDAQIGHDMWVAHVNQQDQLADLTLGKVALPIRTE